MQNDDLLANVTEVAGSKVLPPCVVLARIGRGGMGAVYRARHLNLDIDVAVKVMKPQLVAEDPQFVSRFRREGQSAARISHQNVIRVYDVAEFGGLHYLIMELVDGETARQRVERKGPLAVGEAVQILYEAANGLGEAHRLGFVHRDIKPDNLLIAFSGQVKVADMGLAKPAHGGGQSLVSSPNQIMGTPAYMPPEQWETTAVQAPADVWALGATLYFLLAGHDAIQDPDQQPARLMRKILLQPFPDIRAERPDVPDDVVALIARATAKDPGARFLDAGEMAQAIEQLAVRRTSLRDPKTGQTEAQTLVSPPPLKDLAKIKQWLREDYQTRIQPVSEQQRAAAAATGAGTAPAPEPPPPGLDAPADAAGPAAPPARIGRWLIAMTSLAVLAGAGWNVWRKWNAPAPSPGESERREVAQRLQVPLDRLPVEYPYGYLPTDAWRYGTEAEGRAADGKWTEALTLLTKGLKLQPENPLVIGSQRRVRTLVEAAAKQVLRRETPAGPVPRGTEVQVAGTLPFAAVRELRIDDEVVARDADGRFATTRTFDAPAEIVVLAVLVDDARVELARWPVELQPAPPAPRRLFRGEPRADQPLGTTAGGYVITDASVLEVRGELEDAGTELFQGTTRLVLARDGESFRCQVAVPEEGEQTLVLTARRAGAADQQVELRVLRLTAGPTVTIVAPGAGERTEALTTTLRVRADRWTAAVELVDGEQRQPLAREPGDAPLWRLDVPLRPGTNELTIEASNVAGRRSARQTVAVVCAAPAAAIGKVMLVDTVGGPQVLEPGSTAWLRSPDAELRVDLAGTGARLRVAGEPAERLVPLRGRLQEGRRIEVELLPTGPLGDGTPWRLGLFLDTTPPTATLRTPAAGGKVAADAEVVVSGTWQDAGGCRRVLVGTEPAAVVADTDDRGTWSIALPPPQTDRTLQVDVFDRAGNRRTLSCPIVVAAAVAPAPEPAPPRPIDPNPPARVFTGFAPDGAADAEGYPARLRHIATGIELVALAGPPRLYVAVTETTERQWSGTGDATPKGSVAARDVFEQWLPGRGKGLDLPTAAEWDRIVAARNPAIRDLEAGLAEWLKAEPTTVNRWPVRGDASTTDWRWNSSLPRLGFRTVFRP